MAAQKGKKTSAGAFQKTLLDSGFGYREMPGWEIDAAEFGMAGERKHWSITFDTLHGGKQEGVDVVEVDNGRMSFNIIPTRGMGIFEAWCDGLRLGWDSPVGEIVNPLHVNPGSRGGLGWLEGFNEWLVRCGMANNGAPYEGGSLHGRVANTPASTVSVSVGLDAPHTITVYGAVQESCVFFENLLLETEITTEPGANWLRVRDRVTNLCSRAATAQMLYHINYGIPLLDEGARVVAPVDWLCPRDAGSAAASIRAWDRYPAPTRGAEEQCMYMGLKADRKGETRQMLRNEAGDLAVVQSYRLKDLPCFTLWKKPGAVEDCYVTGLEPATNFPNPKPFEEKKRRVIRLAAGRSWEASFTIAVEEGKQSVRAAEKKIKAIQGRRKPEISTEPLARYTPAGA
jgi:hypothetical protein